MAPDRAVELRLRTAKEGVPEERSTSSYRNALEEVRDRGRTEYVSCQDRQDAQVVYNGLKRALEHVPGLTLKWRTQPDSTVNIYIEPQDPSHDKENLDG